MIIAEAGIYIEYLGTDTIINVWFSKVRSNKNQEIQKVTLIQDILDFFEIK